MTVDYWSSAWPTGIGTKQARFCLMLDSLAEAARKPSFGVWGLAQAFSRAMAIAGGRLALDLGRGASRPIPGPFCLRPGAQLEALMPSGRLLVSPGCNLRRFKQGHRAQAFRKFSRYRARMTASSALLPWARRRYCPSISLIDQVLNRGNRLVFGHATGEPKQMELITGPVTRSAGNTLRSCGLGRL